MRYALPMKMTMIAHLDLFLGTCASWLIVHIGGMTLGTCNYLWALVVDLEIFFGWEGGEDDARPQLLAMRLRNFLNFLNMK